MICNNIFEYILYLLLSINQLILIYQKSMGRVPNIPVEVRFNLMIIRAASTAYDTDRLCARGAVSAFRNLSAKFGDATQPKIGWHGFIANPIRAERGVKQY